MARRRLLGDDAWARLLDPPTDELEIARLCTLTTDDLALIGNRRTDATRLGYTLVLLYLRHPGRVLEIGEVPPDEYQLGSIPGGGKKDNIIAKYTRN
jgi:hypothetical protein